MEWETHHACGDFDFQSVSRHEWIEGELYHDLHENMHELAIWLLRKEDKDWNIARLLGYWSDALDEVQHQKSKRVDWFTGECVQENLHFVLQRTSWD